MSMWLFRPFFACQWYVGMFFVLLRDRELHYRYYSTSRIGTVMDQDESVGLASHHILHASTELHPSKHSIRRL